MNQNLVDIETYLARRPSEVCQVLGVAYSSYMAYRKGGRELPDYIEMHLRTLRALPADTLNQIVRERLRVHST